MTDETEKENRRLRDEVSLYIETIDQLLEFIEDQGLIEKLLEMQKKVIDTRH